MLGGCWSTARSAHSVIKMDSAGSGTTGWHTSTACFGFEYLDADWGANAALNHMEDFSMTELAGTARVPRDRTQHHRWRGPLSDSRGLPWACPRVLHAARAAFVR